MKKILIIALSLIFVFSLVACDNDVVKDDRPIPSGPVPGWEDPSTVYCPSVGYTYDYENLDYDLVWSDEFDGDSLDETYWTYKVNSGNSNDELQYYTNRNTTVQDGILSINALLEYDSGYSYTSARIYTRDKVDWTYGIFEVRAKLPSGVGTWPAIWMMPTDYRYGGWPDSGEIDIMEHVGYQENVVHGTIHTEAYNHMIGTQKGSSVDDFDDVTDEFHVYKIEWLPDQLRFYMDDKFYFLYKPSNSMVCPSNEEWPFDDDFYMILNVAIGGSWGGSQGVDNDIFPVAMEIDYVRVYQSETITNIEQDTYSTE